MATKSLQDKVVIVTGAGISVCHGVGGMFAASGTIIMSNEGP